MEDLIKHHEQEWDDYLKRRNETLQQVVEDEFLIRMHHGFEDDNMNPAWLDKVRRDRKAWTEEWGVKGWRHAQLKERHAEERKISQQMGGQNPTDRHGWLRAWEHGEFVAEEPSGDPAYPIRDLLYDQLGKEHEAIRSFYREQAREEIPETVEARLKKEEAAFLLEWDGISPDKPLDEWKVHDLQDEAAEFKSWYDLMESHEIIERFYSDEHLIPEPTRKRMASAIDEFWREVETLKQKAAVAEQKSEAEPTKEPEIRRSFKEQLKAIRERNHVLRPRCPS